MALAVATEHPVVQIFKKRSDQRRAKEEWIAYSLFNLFLSFNSHNNNVHLCFVFLKDQPFTIVLVYNGSSSLHSTTSGEWSNTSCLGKTEVDVNFQNLRKFTSTSVKFTSNQLELRHFLIADKSRETIWFTSNKGNPVFWKV